MHSSTTNNSNRTFVPINGFNNIYEITTSKPYLVRRIGTNEILDEWYNGYGDAAVLVDNELYLITELLEKTEISISTTTMYHSKQ